MSRTDWRLPGGYEDLRSLDAPGFAWEYLRRNPKFAQDRAKLARASRRGTLANQDEDDFARHWGVRFRDVSTRGRRRNLTLDECRAAECELDCPIPRRPRKS